MPNLLIKPNKNHTILHNITPENANWQYVGFSVVQLAAQQTHQFHSEHNKEYCLTLLYGRADIQVNEQHYTHLGQRQSVFDDQSPYAVYIPPNSQIHISAHTDLEIALSSAPAQGHYPPRLILPEHMRRSTRGQGSNTRYICDILPEDAPAESLLVVEVITPAGNSSSYPPHKHDQQSANETLLEETYYHCINPPQGFAFQRVYTQDRTLDETMSVENRDVVLVPKGYHPCAAVHGYDLYYLNTMAGPERRWQFSNDPEHEWLIAPPK